MPFLSGRWFACGLPGSGAGQHHRLPMNSGLPELDADLDRAWGDEQEWIRRYR